VATNLEKLRGLLQELFQLDQADLDFGIYRIMNQKRDEVVRFLDNDLLPQVQAAFKQYKSADKSVLQGELDKAIQQAQSLGVDPESTNKVKELRQQLGDSAVDVTSLENEVFSHLFNFFRRYYSEGDFISLRRYKEGVYAIPYEGEEVKLHWANADQYYVKSSETFRDYTFKVAGGKRVRVHLVAASTEQDNNKPTQGKERRFVLAENPVSEENDELFIRYEYRPVDSKAKQDELNKQAIQAILKSTDCKQWAAELGKLAPTDKNRDRTVLEKHLFQYTARNTFDYFIHKDLGGFLRRELDFYIKNEVMHLDDIEHESAPKVEQYLSQIKVIRSIAHKIIQFLEQLENFQKKLWLKKKFVIETNYCITLDRVPEELYPEIAKNDAQREEWVRLFAIDQIEKDLSQPGYSTPLKATFLKAHPHLVLDTKHFSTSFRDKLLSAIEELDEQCSGVMFNSDNFHALSLIQRRFQEQVSCVYIDPPYNTGSDGFIYRDSYQHASWLSFLHDRLSMAVHLMDDLGSLFMSIDDNEQVRLRELTDSLMGQDNFVASVIWQKNYSPKNSARHFSVDHDYVLVYARNAAAWTPFLLPRTEEANARYQNPDNDPRGPWKPSDLTARNYYSKGQYEIKGPTGKAFRSGVGRYWRQSEESFWKLVEEKRVWWGPNNDSMPAQKRFLSEVQQGRVPQTLWPYKEVGHTQDAKKELLATVPYTDTGDVLNTVKPTALIRRVIQLGTPGDSKSVVLDFFAGSGTTIQAVLQQNAEDAGQRTFIAVEMGRYFDTTTKVRAIRSLFNPTWKDSKPIGEKPGSGIIKYVTLESYEDALNNLELKRTAQQGTLLDADAEMRQQYILSYMLDVESRGSQSLLNVEAFRNPDEYRLRVERNGETQLVNVDLVETFNWLLGLTVKHIDVIRGVRVVEGTAPNGDRVLVLWRNIDQMDNDALDKWFEKQDYNTREMVYDVFYVNGDNNLENLRRPDQTWKVRMIEDEFQRLMFDVENI
jgi:adenine-specific DNA-methyltransferase